MLFTFAATDHAAANHFGCKSLAGQRPCLLQTIVLAQPIVAMLNHLLAQSGWAPQRLARFAGRTARFNTAPFSFACTIQDGGMLHQAATDASADASCIIPPSLLPRLALQDEKAFDQIECSGDAALIEEILFLGRNLRWDAAEDLSRITGDIAAERIVNLAKDTHQLAHDTALNLSQALAEYWTEERPLLAKPQQISAFAQEVNALREAVDKLESCIDSFSPSPPPARGRGE